MKRQWMLVAVALSCGSAAAKSCRIELQPPPAEVPQKVWRELAEFSFLIGRDSVDDDSGMTLARNLRRMSNFPALRQMAADWDSLRARSDALADTVHGLAGSVALLQRLCDQLDAVSLDANAPLDEAQWLASVAAVEAQMDAAIAASNPTVSQLNEYAGLLRAAAAHYASQPPPPNPIIRTGPAPSELAAGFSEAAWRWRAVASDLANARRILPVKPVRGSSAPLIAMTAAMRELSRVANDARALSAQRLPEQEFQRYASGDYLYDQCPMIQDRSWVHLENQYWSQKSQVPSLLDGLGNIHPPGPTLSDASNRWQFIRSGNGYWLIRNAGFNQATMALDVASATGHPFHVLSMTASSGDAPRVSGQEWRCAASNQPGHLHLYNRFLSEASALDTYNNSGVAIMLPAGYYTGQYWRVLSINEPAN